jgi:hypothetical protein
MNRLYNETLLFQNLHALCDYLQTGANPEQEFKFYTDKIAIDHNVTLSKNDNLFSIRIWRTMTAWNCWYNSATNPLSDFIGALDYSIRDQFIKIEYMSINDPEYSRNHFEQYEISMSEALLLNKTLLNFIKRIAKETKKQKIIIDVHRDLSLYERYYEREGFVLTLRKHACVPNWLEAEYVLGLSIRNI